MNKRLQQQHKNISKCLALCLQPPADLFLLNPMLCGAVHMFEGIIANIFRDLWGFLAPTLFQRKQAGTKNDVH